MYQCLKKGWLPLKDFSEKIGKDKNNVSRYLKELDDKYKCYVGQMLIVYEKEAIKFIPNKK